MKANGLKKITILSNVKPLIIQNDQHILENFKGTGWFIAYLFHRVVIGKFINGTFDYFQKENFDVNINNLIKLRIFDANSELCVWRTNLGGFKGRLRKDEEGVSTDVVDTNQIIFGTKAEFVGESYVKLSEKRGTEIIMPVVEGLSFADINEQDGRLCIHTRSYIGEIKETGQATYEDVRFVKFVKYQEVK